MAAATPADIKALVAGLGRLETLINGLTNKVGDLDRKITAVTPSGDALQADIKKKAR